VKKVPEIQETNNTSKVMLQKKTRYMLAAEVQASEISI
jgi:uncharacterized protein YgiM (DUF1202 family)